jgi:hypothetical protein
MAIPSRLVSLLVMALWLQSVVLGAPDDGTTFLATLLDGLRTHNIQLVARLFQYPFLINAPACRTRSL